MNTSEKRVSIKTYSLFFCQRDCSRRDGISKQQAYGTSYCWQIPSRRLKGKQAEESEGLLPLCSSFWYEIWYSFWYDGGKKSTFLEFRYFFTYNISRKTKRNYRFEMIYDYRFEIYNFIFALFSIWYMTVILKWAKKIWLSLWYDTGSGSLRIRVPEPKIFEGKILIYRFSSRNK